MAVTLGEALAICRRMDDDYNSPIRRARLMAAMTTADDPTPTPTPTPTPPGEPLESGFDFRPSQEVPEAHLSPEAQERVRRKMISSDQARIRAAREAPTAYIAGPSPAGTPETDT